MPVIVAYGAANGLCILAIRTHSLLSFDNDRQIRLEFEISIFEVDQKMSQRWFRELDSATYLPKGYLSFFETMDRLGRAKFPKQWHGEDEFRLRNVAPSSGGSARFAQDRMATIKMMLSESSLPEASELLKDEAELSMRLNQLRLEADQPDIDAHQRYADLAAELLEALRNGQIIAKGLADDGTEIVINHQLWRAKIAETVLKEGVCAIGENVFVARVSRNSPQTRFLMFDIESVDALILKRSSRIEPKKREVFESAHQWLYQQMRRSPTLRPKPRDDFRKEFNKANNAAIPVRDWAKIWKLCIKEADAPKWSKTGPTKSL